MQITGKKINSLTHIESLLNYFKFSLVSEFFINLVILIVLLHKFNKIL